MSRTLTRPMILTALLALAACGGGGGNDAPATFDLMFEAPDGSGFVGGGKSGLRYLPALLQDHTLSDGIVVTGQVTDDLGDPMDGVEVSFHTSASAPAVDSGETNGAGNYSVTVSAGTWVVRIDSDSDSIGVMEVAGRSVSGPGPVSMDFQFAAPVTASGTVFEDLGPAIPNAQLRFTGTRTGSQVTETCDGAGFYSADLMPDTYSVVVTPVGPAAATQLKERFPSVDVSVAGTFDFMLTAGVQVSGTVLDNFGAPLLDDTEIDVRLPQNSRFFAPDDVQADESDGTYSIGPVPSGSVTFEFNPSGDTGFPRQRITRQISGPTTETEDFSLDIGYVLSGTILRDDGLTPEENVEVKAIPTNGSLAPDDDDTDGSGLYEISLLPGTYDLEIMPETTNLQLPEVRRITISGDTTLDVTLALGALVQGTVTQPGGLIPEENVRVEIAGVLGASAKTDGSGDYSFLAPAGMHTLTLAAEDGLFEDIALAPVTGVSVGVPGPVNQDIEMALAVTGSTVVTGTVYEPDGMTPAIGAEITARDKNGDVIGRAFSAAGGAYVLVIP